MWDSSYTPNDGELSICEIVLFSAEWRSIKYICSPLKSITWLCIKHMWDCLLKHRMAERKAYVRLSSYTPNDGELSICEIVLFSAEWRSIKYICSPLMSITWLCIKHMWDCPLKHHMTKHKAYVKMSYKSHIITWPSIKHMWKCPPESHIITWLS